jgi:hypothetical protein
MNESVRVPYNDNFHYSKRGIIWKVVDEDGNTIDYIVDGPDTSLNLKGPFCKIQNIICYVSRKGWS